MKKITLALLACVSMASALAAPVSQQRAAALAQTFIAHQAGAPAQLKLAGVERLNKGLYLINFAPKGFAIISADDNADPIVGYSTESNLVSYNMPDNMTYIMDQEADIVCAKAIAGKTSRQWSQIEATGRAAMSRAGEPVDDLIKVTWNQSAPYNAFCPGDGNKKAIVGCVAVAMSQAMSVQQYPVQPHGAVSYVAPSYGTLSIDFDKENPYDWSAILSGANSKSEVARLLFHAGMSVFMDYGTDGSGIPASQPYRISNALKNNFAYGNDVTCTWRRDYKGDWTQFLLNELYAGRAIVYNATDSKGGYGHSFNIDGYNGANFHVNWGWGGYGNGYFSIDRLTDAQMSMNYDSNHVAITGIGGGNSPLRAVYLPDVAVEEKAPAGTTVSALLVNGEAPTSDMNITVTGEYKGNSYASVPFEYKNGQIVTTRPLEISEGPIYVRIQVTLKSDPSVKLSQGYNIQVEHPQTIAAKTSLSYDRASQTFTVHTKYNASYTIKDAAGTVILSGSVGTLPEFTFTRSQLSNGNNTVEISVAGNTSTVTIKK